MQSADDVPVIPPVTLPDDVTYTQLVPRPVIETLATVVLTIWQEPRHGDPV